MLSLSQFTLGLEFQLEPSRGQSGETVVLMAQAGTALTPETALWIKAKLEMPSQRELRPRGCVDCDCWGADYQNPCKEQLCLLQFPANCTH